MNLWAHLIGRRARARGPRLDKSISIRMIEIMAQRTTVSLIDDLDGQSEADETVEYAVDGVTYEIDLTTDHAEALREVFAPTLLPPGVQAVALALARAAEPARRAQKGPCRRR